MSTCLYCLESGTRSAPLIVPCNCKRVHQECLAKQRATSVTNARRCEICGFEYRVEPMDSSSLRWFDCVRVELYVASGLLLFLVPFFYLCVSVGNILHEVDAKDEGGFQHRWPWTQSSLFWFAIGAVAVFACLGVAFFFIATIVTCSPTDPFMGMDLRNANGAASTEPALLLHNAICIFILAATGAVIVITAFMKLISGTGPLTRRAAVRVLNLTSRERVVDLGDINRVMVLP